ncbi:unnamed protein product [Cochlearia groenlandica]
MGSIKNTVHYCCVSRDNQILYSYNNGGDQRNETLASLCLEKTPPFHKWYFETIAKNTFGFLIDEDGFVCFAIVDHVFKRSIVLEFLQNLRYQFKKAHRRGSISVTSNVQDEVVRKLIASLETTCLIPLSSSLSIDGIGQSHTANSTKAPFLGRTNRQDKKRKKGKDHVVNTLRGIELEEQRKSTDRGSLIPECSNAEAEPEASATTTTTTYVPRRGRSQSIERKWRRQVKIVLAIDAAICLTLLGVWLAICHGIECTRS